MRRIALVLIAAVAVAAATCGTGFAAQTGDVGKDWYVALRLGYQPYTVDVEGEVAGRDFDASADLVDILDKTDTSIFGGEVEFGKGKWFVSLAGFYQKTEADKGDKNLGAEVTFKETGLNPMVGYRVYVTSLGGDKALLVDAMAGLYYVKVATEVDIYTPAGNVSRDKDIDFVDPMVGARAYLALTKKFGVAAAGQIGGFGVGSELQTVLAGNLVYNFTDWFAASAGYKYWYWKYEDSGATLSELEQTLYGPVIGIQLKY